MSNHVTVNIKTLVDTIRSYPPDISILIVGPHGIGKSAISAQLAEHFNILCIDRRLALMTDGDMTGIPRDRDDVTTFIPVDFVVAASKSPVVLLLDELNRATDTIKNAAFQLVYDRMVNDVKLHPETRVIACVNGGAEYDVNDMDPALLNRFAIFHLEPTVDEWLEWARGPRKIDPIITSFIAEHPELLRWKDISKMEPLTPYPTNRSWDRFDRSLAYAGLNPSKFAGKKEISPILYHMACSLLGLEAAISFTNYVKNLDVILSAEDVLDRYDENAKNIANLDRVNLLDLSRKIAEHSGDNTWSDSQLSNLKKFIKNVLNKDHEVLITFFSEVSDRKNLDNIVSLNSDKHGIKIGIMIAEGINKAHSINNEK